MSKLKENRSRAPLLSGLFKELLAISLLTLFLLLLLIRNHSSVLDDLPESRDELPDFAVYSQVKDRKAAFFAYLRPIIQAENRRINTERNQILYLEKLINQGFALKPAQQAQLNAFIEKYRIKATEQQMQFAELRRKVHPVPEALVLIQAANESAWGRSRFAREANNLFGQWCFKKGCGIVPENRSKNARHEVARFATPRDSVRSYLLNINRHFAYKDLRILRQKIARSGEDVTAYELAQGLLRYSERGEEYVDEIRLMIEQNNLE